MKKLLFLLAVCTLASCGLLRKKEKTTSEKETVLSEQKKEVEISKDSSQTLNYTRITYGGANPFKTPEAKSFMTALFNLSALQMPAKQLDSAINDLKSKYNDFSNTANSLAAPKTHESWTNAKTGSNTTKTKEENKNLKQKEKVVHVEKASVLESIPWYVWMLGIIAILVLLALYLGLPKKERLNGLPRFENPPPSPPLK